MESWNGMEWNGFQWSMIILKGAGRPGQLRPDFFSKMDFHRPHVSQHFSNDKDKILQDVSSLPFYPKTRSVDSLFRIPTFCFDRLFAQTLKNPKKLVFSKNKKRKKKRRRHLLLDFFRFLFRSICYRCRHLQYLSFPSVSSLLPLPSIQKQKRRERKKNGSYSQFQVDEH